MKIKTTIDKETIFREALKKEEATRTRRYEEAIINGDLPPLPEPEIPDWVAPRAKKRSLLGYFNLLLI